MPKKGKRAASDKAPAPAALSPHSLASSNLALATWAAAKAIKLWTVLGLVEWEELVGEAVVGLVRAANHFDASRGFRFSTFAASCMLNRLGQMAKRMGRPKAGTGRVRRFSEMMGERDAAHVYRGSDGREWQEPGTESDPSVPLMAREAVEGLPERERAVMVLRETEGCGFAEIGERLGVTRQAAQQAYVRARRKAREQGGTG